MLSIPRARKILGKKYSHLTDEEIEALLAKTHSLADMVTSLISKKVFESPASIIDYSKETGND